MAAAAADNTTPTRQRLQLIAQPRADVLVRQPVAPLEDEPAVERQRHANHLIDEREQCHVDDRRDRRETRTTTRTGPADSATDRRLTLSPVASRPVSSTTPHASDTTLARRFDR